MRSLLVFVNLLFVFVSASAQLSLKGKVIAGDTKKPIASANVFLANTSVGTSTKEDGGFLIDHFPAGRYDLVVSFIGYESTVISVRSNQLPGDLTITLKPKVNELQEVILEPYEKNGWEKWGNFFVENFIGTSAFAEDCQLFNGDALKFRFSKKNNTLQVFANDRLQIENKALGYVLKYDMTRFDYDFNTRLFVYQGYPLFEEMQPKNERTRRRWSANRQEAYYGSMMHFMRSLYRNKLIEQHFEVRKLIKISTAEKKRVKAAYTKAKIPVLRNGTMIITEDKDSGLSPDTLAYYRKVMQDPDAFDVLINQVLPGDSIAYAVDSLVVGMEFPECLQVVYTPKNTPAEYSRAIRKMVTGPITSEIFRVSEDAILVLANGSYFEGTNLISSGYWGWSEKIAQLLPLDYWPPPKTK